MKYYYRIRQLRKEASMTQKQIASLLNCSQQAYSDYESAKRRIPIRILIRFTEIYHVSTDYILELTDKKEPHKPISKD